MMKAECVQQRSKLDVERFIRQDWDTLPPYKAVASLESLAERVGIPVEQLVRLDQNENPYGPSPRALAALRTIAPERYGDSRARRLREALAAYCGMSVERIVVGNGGGELIDLLCRLLLDPGDEVIDCPPTFGVYRVWTRVNRGHVVEVPRDEHYAIDIEAVERAIGPRTKLIVVCNPNNPTGTITPRSALERLLTTGLPLLLDETYVEFAGQSAIDLLDHYPNLMILRTLSKWCGLAGLRVGYGLFPETIAERLLALKPAYNLNVAGEAAALASLQDIAFLMARVQQLRQSTEELSIALSAFPWLQIAPSVTNFLYCRTCGVEARWVHQELERRGVLVRYFSEPPALRISAGTQEQNQRLLAALAEIDALVSRETIQTSSSVEARHG
jgi:histidinol-phosphate aminotransferase